MARTAPLLRWASYVVGLLLVARCSLGMAEEPAPDEPPLGEQIDQLIESAYQGPPSPLVNDAEFLRRVSLDLVGMIPSADEVRTFLRESTDDKRERLVDRLLTSPEHARHLSHVFDLILMERRPEKNVKISEWREYLRSNFAENRPYNEIAAELLSADGADPAKRGAARFMLDRDCEPPALTRDVGRLFFGMDMQCAQCHDHPVVDDYKQADYFGLYAFVNRTYVFQDKALKLALVAEKGLGETKYKSVFTGDADDSVEPRVPLGEAITGEPKFAKGEEYTVKAASNVRPIPKFSRRMQLVELLEAGNNPAFQRNIVNRIWAQLFGRGLVHPVDLHHSGNLASHPKLLDLLAQKFADSDYNLRQLYRTLVLTRAYQRSCRLPEGAEKDTAWDRRFVSGSLKPLSAEQMGFSLMRAVGLLDAERLVARAMLVQSPPEVVQKAAKNRRTALMAQLVEKNSYDKLTESTQTFLQLYDIMPSQDFQATIHQALFISNGTAVTDWLKPEGDNLAARLGRLNHAEALSEELYLCILSRYPTQEESADVAAYLREVPDRPAAINEMTWGLLTSNEFRFNH